MVMQILIPFAIYHFDTDFAPMQIIPLDTEFEKSNEVTLILLGTVREGRARAVPQRLNFSPGT